LIQINGGVPASRTMVQQAVLSKGDLMKSRMIVTMAVLALTAALSGSTVAQQGPGDAEKCRIRRCQGSFQPKGSELESNVAIEFAVLFHEEVRSPGFSFRVTGSDRDPIIG